MLACRRQVGARVFAMDGEQARYWSTGPAQQVGVPLKREVAKRVKLHHKVDIVDGRTVILGSCNWTRPANDENDENTLIVRNPAIGKMFADAFNEPWNDVLQ